MRTRVLSAIMIFTIVMMGAAMLPRSASAEYQRPTFNHPHFEYVWDRFDGPVLNGTSNRSWSFGPELVGAEHIEVEDGMTVQYFEKARMELADPNVHPSQSLWSVRNGRLIAEMMTGLLEPDPGVYVPCQAPTIPVAGDLNQTGPNVTTYRTFEGHYKANHYEIAPEFKDFIEREYGADWVNVLGYTMTSGWWIDIMVDGQPRKVVYQAFERLALIFSPNNPPQWQVELTNVGQHYMMWRYAEGGCESQTENPPPPSDSPVYQYDTGAMPDLPVSLDHSAWTIHASGEIDQDPDVKRFMEQLPDPAPQLWKVFPNRNNPEVPEFDVHKGGVEYGVHDSPYCYVHPCDVVVPAWEYRYISGDYSFQGVTCALGESNTGCMLLLVNVGAKSHIWRKQVVDNGFTLHGRYWDGGHLDQAIWALVSHGSANMLNMFTYGNDDEVLNSGYPGNAGANCGVPNGCGAVHVRVVIHAEGRIIAVGETTVTRP